MRKPKMPKLGAKRINKAGIGAAVVTAVFAALGATFLIIGYHDTVLQWMATVGVAFCVVAAIPLIIIGYNKIQKKIDS